MNDSLFLKAMRLEPTERPPIWLMRQAGRYMAQYRAAREGKNFLEVCKSPKLCAEIMATAVEILGVDAAIVFSDLLPILEPMGFKLEFTPGDGPQIANPVDDANDLARVAELVDVAPLQFVFDAVALTKKAVEPIPTIGFCGAPFTLAGYAIEGKTSRQFIKTKVFMKTEPEAARELLARLARSCARYLNAQIEAGAEVVQIFDSWAGCLSPDDYRDFALPAAQELVANLRDGARAIYFATGNPALTPFFAQTGALGVGVDWRTPIADAGRTIGSDRVLQGNLDPATLLASQRAIAREAARILDAVGERPGFVFNLGHGVLKETPVENAKFLVDFVKNWRATR